MLCVLTYAMFRLPFHLDNYFQFCKNITMVTDGISDRSDTVYAPDNNKCNGASHTISDRDKRDQILINDGECNNFSRERRSETKQPPTSPSFLKSHLNESNHDHIANTRVYSSARLELKMETKTGLDEYNDEQNNLFQRHQEYIEKDLDAVEEVFVESHIDGVGSEDEIVVQSVSMKASVKRKSMRTLATESKITDEIVNYFVEMLSNRDAELSNDDPNRQRSCFFNSFFITKIRNEGNTLLLHDEYQFDNVRKWSKKAPGGDIFKLNSMFFPINKNRNHWILAVVYMKKREIRIYCSLGLEDECQEFVNAIFWYIQDEHLAKHETQLPEMDQWKWISVISQTPIQCDNGKLLLMEQGRIGKFLPLLFICVSLDNRITLSQKFKLRHVSVKYHIIYYRN